MNRKDMIIVAVLLNVVILSVLFILAVNSDDGKMAVIADISQPVVLDDKLPARLPKPPVAVVQDEDEPMLENKFELILGDLDSNDNDSLSRNDEWAVLAARPVEDIESKVIEELSSGNIVEIIVKKGDSLDRIARANSSSIQSIRALNSLKNDHLKIGQVLSVDVGSSKRAQESKNNLTAQNGAARAPSIAKEPVYYTLKSGDSPWKVAKQFNVNMDDLLKMNMLNEEKARNLKVGDKIRVQ